MHFNRDTLGGQLPVGLLDHLIVEVFVVFENFIKVIVVFTTLQLVFLLLIALLFLVDLDKGLFDYVNIGLHHLDGKFETRCLLGEVLGVALRQVAIVDVVQGQRLHDGKAAMVLVHIEHFLKLLFPAIWVDGAGLELIFDFLGSKDAQGLNKGLFGALGHRRVLFFDLLGVENLLQAILSHLECGFVCLHVSVGPPKLDIVEDAPIQVLDRRQDQVVVEAEHVEGQVVGRLLGVACLSQ